jgi:hypothetical protein
MFDEGIMSAGGIKISPIKLPPLVPGVDYSLPNTASVPPAAPSQPKKADFSKVLQDTLKPAAKEPVKASDDDKTAMARQLESFLLSLVFKKAFENKFSSGLYGDSYASRMYLDMFIDAAVDEAVKTANLGIADSILADINKAGQNGLGEGNEAEELRGMRKSDAGGP